MKIAKINVTKNNVSYFIAGYKAALVYSGKCTPGEVEMLDYSTLDFGNYTRRFLRAYDSREFDFEGTIAMYKELTKHKYDKKD